MDVTGRDTKQPFRSSGRRAEARPTYGCHRTRHETAVSIFGEACGSSPYIWMSQDATRNSRFDLRGGVRMDRRLYATVCYKSAQTMGPFHGVSAEYWNPGFRGDFRGDSDPSPHRTGDRPPSTMCDRSTRRSFGGRPGHDCVFGSALGRDGKKWSRLDLWSVGAD